MNNAAAAATLFAIQNACRGESINAAAVRAQFDMPEVPFEDEAFHMRINAGLKIQPDTRIDDVLLALLEAATKLDGPLHARESLLLGYANFILSPATRGAVLADILCDSPAESLIIELRNLGCGQGWADYFHAIRLRDKLKQTDAYRRALEVFPERRVLTMLKL